MNNQMTDQQLKKIGERVKELREGKAFTQEQLAAKADLQRQTIASVEKGKLNFQYKTISSIATALKCDLEIILKEKI